ncbi:zf-HC2 domain-containing protein [Agrococcus sp. DT81.2]|uniref:zf-HC2 domain-containing protein n=1 Tax=Agrococcus sp. DT81.2 TaxID=3393414 RepID=UPI003CE5B4DB
MSADHADFADWDAAYLLGALSPADRRAFEEHLESCDRCVRSIADVAPTLGLLGRVDPDRAQSLRGDEAPQEWPPVGTGARAALLARAAHDARRRRGRWTGALATAAAIIVAVIVAVSALLPPAGGGRAVELAAVVDAPLVASVELASAAWGTRIELECRYGGDGGAGASTGLPYTLVVRDRDGNASEVSSWRAVPGATARLTAATALDVDEIAAVEIRMEGSGEVLMRAEIAEQ